MALETRHRLADAAQVASWRRSRAHAFGPPAAVRACASARRVCTRTISRL
jgi:hypothetical protein